MDISKLMGAGGGGGMMGGGMPMMAMGGLGGLGGMKMGGMMPGMGGGKPPMDPRMQGATIEQVMDPNGSMAMTSLGGRGQALNPVQAAMLQEKFGRPFGQQGGAPPGQQPMSPNPMMSMLYSRFGGR